LHKGTKTYIPLINYNLNIKNTTNHITLKPGWLPINLTYISDFPAGTNEKSTAQCDAFPCLNV